jgi:DNA-directed RNA polymerase subunit alpha
MLQNQTILENLYNDVEDIKKIANTESLIITLDRVLFLIGSYKNAYEAEIEIAKLLGRNELLHEMLHKKNEQTQLSEAEIDVRNLLKTKLIDYEYKGLTPRSLNCFKAVGIETIGDLVSYPKRDILRLRNMGEKSLKECEDFLEDLHGFYFGMNTDRYLLNENI